VQLKNNSYLLSQGHFGIAEPSQKFDYTRYNITALPFLHHNIKMKVIVGVIVDDIHRF
jgi:hypothetical protein